MGLTLAAGHALQVASFWEERAQDEMFGNGIPRRVRRGATGTAVKVDGGWRITGAWPYSSGAPYSTYYMGQTLIRDEGVPPRMTLFVAERSQWEMLDDWGDLLGLRGSGSHTVELEDAFVPDGWALPDTQLVEVDVSGGTPGSRLHGNPMYAGRCFSVFQLELTALMIGAAKGALDEYQAIVTTKRTQRPPTVIRAEDPDYQRWFGMSIGKLATAEAAMLNGADQWTEFRGATSRRTPGSRARTTWSSTSSRARGCAWRGTRCRSTSSAPPAPARCATASACSASTAT